MAKGNPDEGAKLLGSTNYSNYDAVETTHLDGDINGVAYKRRWCTIRILYFTMFNASLGFALMSVVLWPFFKKVDRDLSPRFLGWTVAGYSLAQLVGSLIFGVWCRYRPSKEPLYASFIIAGVGSILYTYAQEFQEFGPEVILISRIILGFYAGNASVVRAVVAQSTTIEERTRAVANTGLAQALGFIFGPAFAALTVPIGDRGYFVSPIRLHLNIYTAPGLIRFVLTVVNLVVLMAYFYEEKLDLYPEDDTQESSMDRKPDMFALVMTALLFFMNLCIFAVNETILAPLLMNEYAWTRTQTVLYGGIISCVAGAISSLAFVAMRPFLKKYGDRPVLSAGLVFTLVGFIVMLPWGNKFPQLALQQNTTSSIEQTVGCPRQYNWCHTTPQINLFQYLTGFFIVAVGYPIAFVVLNALYSKILGPVPQGVYMGWLTAVGCLARVLGPIIVTFMYVHFGPRWVFFSIDVFITIAIVICFILYHRFVPFHEYTARVMTYPQSS